MSRGAATDMYSASPNKGQSPNLADRRIRQPIRPMRRKIRPRDGFPINLRSASAYASRGRPANNSRRTSAQRRERLGIVGIAAATHPQRLFVQLNTLAVDRAEHHGAHPAFADRERVVPLRSGRRQPDRVIAGGRETLRSCRRAESNEEDQQVIFFVPSCLRGVIFFVSSWPKKSSKGILSSS
jgi:hypothetical protein